ncbi:insulin-like growth factor-binding protein complex acid labile subunit [Trichogramma pretiosum]|uniref:insulin-like growth factor-binding protein complex acid labile subunit n=1 Tax=Trichogramma pretiosum TaxID=7493 RepID=UPI000C719B10|nr:insulin-like growth factor-binding protein complex acid labile subunit [Trichogramma pretiosum]
MSRSQISDFTIFILSYLLIIYLTRAENLSQCPTIQEMIPCSCTVKKNGLDVICEFTDFKHISRAMDSLKKRQNSIIFYLKLRHNDLPKLQGFVFLGLNIHHLTIHNSSLAVIEETSLSSIGKSLTQLDISQNSLASVPSVALKNLHHLLILNINHNKITIIHKRAFEGLDTLEILTVYENKLSMIEFDAFKGIDKNSITTQTDRICPRTRGTAVD